MTTLPAKRAATRKKKAAPHRPVTTMRLRQDILDALGKEATKRGISRNLMGEHVLAAYLKRKGYRVGLEPKI